MRVFSLLLVILWLVVLPRLNVARADSYELLSYSELMNLPREKRIQYVEGVREILIDLSKTADGRFSDSDLAARSRLRAWLEWIDRDMRPAYAASSAKAALCKDDPDCAHAQLDCFSQRHLGVKWSGSRYECDEGQPIVAKRGFNLFGTGEDRTLKKLKEKAVNPRLAETPSVPIEIGYENSGGQSIVERTAGSFSAAPTIREYVDGIAQGSNKYKCVSKHQSVSTPATQGLEPCADVTEKLIDEDFKRQMPLKLVAPAPEATSSAATSASAPPAPAPVTEEKASPAAITVKIRDQSEHAAVVEAVPEKISAEPPSEKSLGGDSEKSTNAPPSSGRHSKRKLAGRGSKSTALDLSKYSCAPAPEKCDDPKSSRAKVFQGNLACVFAGMISKFDSQNRKCEAVTEFKLGDASYKCGAGQTMCNPLLFGTISTSKAICVGRGHDVTVQCSKLSSARDAEVFLNRNESGLQNRWDEFRTAMANVCKPGSIQAKFHCVECGVMKTRLFELHARLVGDPCKAGAPSFENAIKARTNSRGSSTSK